MTPIPMRIYTFGLNLEIHFGSPFLSRESWHFAGSLCLRKDLDPGDLLLNVTLWLMAGLVRKGFCTKPLSMMGGGVQGGRWKTSVQKKKKKRKNWRCQ